MEMKLSWSGDRTKTPVLHPCRTLTRDEVLALQSGAHAVVVLNNGRLGTVKINGEVRRWKRDPDRVEVPVKYGMYEYATLSLKEAMERLVVFTEE